MPDPIEPPPLCAQRRGRLCHLEATERCDVCGKNTCYVHARPYAPGRVACDTCRILARAYGRAPDEVTVAERRIYLSSVQGLWLVGPWEREKYQV